MESFTEARGVRRENKCIQVETTSVLELRIFFLVAIVSERAHKFI